MMFVNTLVKKLEKAFGIYGNPTEIPIIRRDQFRDTKIGKKMDSFGNFGRIAKQVFVWVFILVRYMVTFFTKTFDQI